MVSALSVVVHSQLLLRSQDWPPHLQSRTEGLKPPVTRLTSHLRGYLPGMAPATTNALTDISGIISVIQSVYPDAERMSDSTYTKTIRAMQFAMFHCLLNAGLFAGHKWLIAQLVAG